MNIDIDLIIGALLLIGLVVALGGLAVWEAKHPTPKPRCECGGTLKHVNINHVDVDECQWCKKTTMRTLDCM